MCSLCSWVNLWFTTQKTDLLQCHRRETSPPSGEGLQHYEDIQSSHYKWISLELMGLMTLMSSETLNFNLYIFLSLQSQHSSKTHNLFHLCCNTIQYLRPALYHSICYYMSVWTAVDICCTWTSTQVTNLTCSLRWT